MLLLPPPAHIAPAQPPLEGAVLAFCQGVASQMGWEARIDPAHMEILRHQAAAMRSICAPALPTESQALLLLEATLGVLESAAGEEAKGERRYGRAASLLAQRVMALGFKPSADRVWKLAATHGEEGLRLELATLMDRLDPATLLEDAGRLEAQAEFILNPVEGLIGTPLEPAARGLLKRLDAHICEGKRASQKPFRRRIARSLGDWGGVAGLLREELVDSKTREAIPSLLGEAETLLRDHPDPDLLEVGTRRLKDGLLTKLCEDRDFPRSLVAWAGLQRAAGHPEEAEELIRLRLAMTEPEDQDPAPRCELLARLGRWKELEAFLGPAQNQESAQTLGWRFQAALGQGREADLWAVAWVARISGPDGPDELPLLPGLGSALSHFQANPAALNLLVARHGPRLLPGQEALLAREPWRILVALDPEAPSCPLPEKVEEALRWRWSRLPRDASRLAHLEGLIKETEARLGSVHPFVAELLVDLGGRQGMEGLSALERAQQILEVSEGREEALAKVFLTKAEASAFLDGQGLGRNLLKALAILERLPRLSREAEEWVGFIPSVVGTHLWREQRLEEAESLGLRMQAQPRAAGLP